MPAEGISAEDELQLALYDELEAKRDKTRVQKQRRSELLLAPPLVPNFAGMVWFSELERSGLDKSCRKHGMRFDEDFKKAHVSLLLMCPMFACVSCGRHCCAGAIFVT